MKKNNTSQQPASSAVLYEDNHLLVINKAAGELVQGDQTGDVPLVEKAKQYLKLKYQKPGNVFLGVVHRLDRPTSGVLVFARTSKALSRLNDQFKQRETSKVYWAIVEGHPEDQTQLTHWLLRKPKNNKSYAYSKEVKGSKKAILDVKVVRHLDRYSCLAIQLHTGRHHQIRVQLSTLGHPIKGDVKYNAHRGNADASIHLHAKTLCINHPVTQERMCWEAPLPIDPLWKLCANDRFDLPSP